MLVKLFNSNSLTREKNYIFIYEFGIKKELIALQTYKGTRNLINDEGFHGALYLIDIGQNDLADSFAKNLSYVQVIKKIPVVITEIENAVKVSPAFFKMF